MNGILHDHYTLKMSTESAYGRYVFLVLKVALWNHINFDTYFEPLSNNYKTLSVIDIQKLNNFGQLYE